MNPEVMAFEDPPVDYTIISHPTLAQYHHQRRCHDTSTVHREGRAPTRAFVSFQNNEATLLESLVSPEQRRAVFFLGQILTVRPVCPAACFERHDIAVPPSPSREYSYARQLEDSGTPTAAI